MNIAILAAVAEKGEDGVTGQKAMRGLVRGKGVSIDATNRNLVESGMLAKVRLGKSDNYTATAQGRALLSEKREYPYRPPVPGLDRACAGGLGDSRAGRGAVILDRIGHALRVGADTRTSRADVAGQEGFITLDRAVTAPLQLRQGRHEHRTLSGSEIPAANVGAQDEVHGVGVVVQVAHRRLDAQLLTREVAVAPVDHGPPVLARAARNN